MKYFKANNLTEALDLQKKHSKALIFSGGTDTVFDAKSGKFDTIIDITFIDAIHFIETKENFVEIGTLTTISELLENETIATYLPILTKACEYFASHQIRNVATLSGNIAHNSPASDLLPVLAVLDTKVSIVKDDQELEVSIEALAQMQNYFIKSFNIPLHEYKWYYRKVGGRNRLNIAKLSLAIAKKEDKYFISGTSLNRFVKRFINLEGLFNKNSFDEELIKKAIEHDVSPSGSFRSTKEYRKKVLFNMLKEAHKELQ